MIPEDSAALNYYRRPDCGRGGMAMPDSSLTKRALAQAIKELMNEKPLVKISIADIVDRCQMNRHSFYYHFRDKYDLVNWIFYTELITELQNSSNKDEYEELKNICRYLYDNRAFYINALKFTGQNSFYEYFGEVIYQLLKAAFNESFIRIRATLTRCSTPMRSGRAYSVG